MKKDKQNFRDEFEKEDERLIRRHLVIFKHQYKFRTGKEPDEKIVEKERKKIIKEYIEQDREGLSQSEKEEGQFQCILDLLYDNNHLSISEMSEHLIESGFTVGSSEKTIYRRILPKLIRRGVLKDDEKKYYIPERKPDIKFEKSIEKEITEEMETVSIISNFLETIKGTPFYEKAKEYIDNELNFQMRRKARHSENDYSENFVSRIIFMGPPATNVKTDFWNKINSAMNENHYIRIQYTAEGKKKSENYTVKPYQLIFDNGFWELWGDCTNYGHRGKRLFNLSRIQDVEILDGNKKFDLPENYDFRYTLAGSFGCYNDNVAEDYSIKIKKESYAYIYIKDRTWGEFQEIKEVDDGYILEFEATQYKPILRWVLSWGSDVEPLEPKKLVDDWKNKIREMSEYLKK